jgi:hypothetical protein
MQVVVRGKEVVGYGGVLGRKAVSLWTTVVDISLCNADLSPLDLLDIPLSMSFS